MHAVSHSYLSLIILCLMHHCLLQAFDHAKEQSLCTALHDQTIQNIIGYDPAIEYIPGIDNQAITLYFHGWNRDKEDVKNKLYFQTPAIIFNFLDASAARQARLCNLCLGQMNDIQPALLILQAVATSGITDAINLVGASRGATTIVNMIGILNNPDYKNELEALGIAEPIKLKILTMISRGTLLLDCPLKHARHGIFNQVQKRRTQLFAHSPEERWPTYYLKIAGNSILACFDYPITYFLSYVYLPICSKYKPWGEEVFSSLDHWQGLNLTTIIRYEKEDIIVGNVGDTEFYEKIRNLNPQKTHLIVSDSCGHCTPYQPLADLFKLIITA